MLSILWISDFSPKTGDLANFLFDLSFVLETLDLDNHSGHL